MSKGNFFTRAEIDRLLSAVVGKTLGEVDVNHVFDRTITKPKITGIAGDVIEQSVLGYSANSRQEADLNIDGVPVELKTTGIKLKKEGNGNKFVAKEPASITAVSIDTIAREVFETSNFWHKAQHLLFVFYYYNAIETVLARRYSEFPIQGYSFYKFSEEDRVILQNDWQLIHDFIAGIQKTCSEDEAKKRYPDLSTVINKETIYLDTAPKYPNPPRFRLRRRVVDFIVDQTINKKKYEKLPDKYVEMNDVEKKCIEITEQYSGKTMGEILTSFGIEHKDDSKVKQFAEQVIVRMFGGQSKKISKIELFKKFGLIGKSVTLTDKGARTEDMKLVSANFEELANPSAQFEESDLYSFFHDNQLLCIVFQEQKKDSSLKTAKLSENVFIGFKILNFDEAFLEKVRETWDAARKTILNGELKFVYDLGKQGNRILNKSQTYKGAPNLPKSKQFDVFFRGTGDDARDKITVLGVNMLKQDYWIKGTYIVNRLNSVPLVGEDILREPE